MLKLRLKITKGEELRYISHLDYARAMERAVRRANIPVAYSEGFNPHMKLAFASALAVGVTSSAEYVDIELNANAKCEELAKKLQAQMPKGLNILGIVKIADKVPALMAVVNCATYNITSELNAIDRAVIAEGIMKFNSAEEIVFNRTTPKGWRVIDIKQFMADELQVEYFSDYLVITVKLIITANGSVKPSEILTCLVEQFSIPVDCEAALIQRTGIFIRDEDSAVSPLDLVRSK